ncbi:UNVERIFIED_CONTAM: protein tas [Sesamum latifolium]|uniref:Protein tas n=1 Tax=Sesamum latifolium TaxID=2727402 RepID=A0AAW2VZ55_9LAMI
MASSSGSSIVPAFLFNNRSSTCGISRRHLTQRLAPAPEGGRNLALLWKWKRKKRSSFVIFSQQRHENALQYKKLGDSDLVISEITLGTMTYGEQNTEKEAHEQLSYSFERGINALDTAEVVCDELVTDILECSVSNPTEKGDTRKDRSVHCKLAEVSTPRQAKLKMLTGQLIWPDRYVALFGEYFYDPSKWRSSVSFIEQLRGFRELIDQGKVRYIGVSNETSYGVMEFVHAAKVEGLPKIVSIQNNYSLLVRCKFELDLVEVCHPNNCNIGLLAYSPLAGGALSGKYLDTDSEAAKRGRLNLFPGYMERYNKSMAKEVTAKYLEVAKKHGLSLVELALGFARDRPFVTSSIIGATTIDQLKEDIDAFLTTERPLPPEVVIDINDIFKRYKDPAID